MIVKEVSVNGSTYKFTLTDSVISQVGRLKQLYAQAYEDPESFEEVSAEISGVISDISNCIEPKATDDDLDGMVQKIILTVDSRQAEVEKQLPHRKKRRS